MPEVRRLEMKHVVVEARVDRVVAEGSDQIVVAILVKRLASGGPRFDWSTGIKNRMVVAVEDAIASLESRMLREPIPEELPAKKPSRAKSSSGGLSAQQKPASQRSRIGSAPDGS